MRIFRIGRSGTADRLIVQLCLWRWGGDLYFSLRPMSEHGKPRVTAGDRYGGVRVSWGSW